MPTRNGVAVVAGVLLYAATAGTPLLGQQFSQIIIDGGTEETGYDALQCSDGSFLITGSTGPYPDPSAEAFLLKLAPSGSILWGRTIGGPDTEHGFRVKETLDGGSIMVGYTRSGSDPQGDILVVRTDANGVVLWANAYGSGLGEDIWEERCYDVLVIGDGGFAVTGGAYCGGNRGWDAFLIKIDQDGNIEWDRTYGLDQTNVTYSISRTSDNGYLLVGHLYWFGFGAHDMMAIKTDSLGTLEFTCIVGGPGDDSGTAGVEITPGHYVLAGMTKSNWFYYDPDIFIVGIDNLTHLSWAKVMIDRGDSQIVRGSVGKDSSISFAGWIADPSRGATDVLLIKCKADGSLPLVRAYGGGFEDRGRSVSLSADGGYLLTGFARRSSGQDVFLAHTDPSGMLGCTDHTPMFFTSSPLVSAAMIQLDTSSGAFERSSLSLRVGTYSPQIIDWCLATAAEQAQTEPASFELTQNYPNPFNPQTWIRYALEHDGEVRLTVHDMLGRVIRVLVDERQDPGSYEVLFDASGLPSGTYFYTLWSGEHVQTKRMVIAR